MDQLLSLKLHRPALPARRVTRPLLLQRLDEGLALGRPVTLISAPAGFGKTTCAAEWLAGLDCPAAWLSLDAGDNDPGRFFTGLAAALQGLPRVAPEQDCFPRMRQVERLLRSGQLPPAESIANALIGDVVELASAPGGCFSGRFLLVLDDFHIVQEPSILRVFELLMSTLFQRSLAQPMHLVIVSREDPPLPLARLRANNRLTEIRAAELRFSGEEAVQFLNEIMELGLAESDVQALKERTEGWAAGLQLAGLSIRGRPDPAGFIRGLNGSHRFILSYLTEEVLSRQPDDVQRFMLRTSILDRLAGPLCDAVTGRNDSALLLEHMANANLFLEPLEDGWYRYHHLFSDLLRSRQAILLRDETLELHRRATEWFAASARTALAPADRAACVSAGVQHALAGQEYAAAVRLIEAHALELLNLWYAKTISAWMQALPAEWSLKSPTITLAFARMHLMHGDFTQAAPYLERLQALFAQPLAGGAAAIPAALQAEWLALRATLANAQGKPAEALEIVRQALAVAAEPDTTAGPPVQALCQVHLAEAVAYQQMNDIPRAVESYQRLIQLGRAAGDVTTALWGLSALALLVIERGQLRRGFDLARQAAELAEHAGLLTPICAGIYGELGQVSFHWGEIDQAGRYFQQAAQVSLLVGFSDAEIYDRVARSRLCLIRADAAGAAREIQQALELMRSDAPAVVREEVIAQQVCVALAQGNGEAAEEALFQETALLQGSHDYPALPSGDLLYPQGVLFLSALRVQLYRARERGDANALKQGFALAGELLDIFRRLQYRPLELQALLLRAQLHAAAGNGGEVLADLEAALDLAQPEGYLSDFVLEGPQAAAGLARLLRLKRERLSGERVEYIEKVLGAFANLPAAEQATGAAGSSLAAAPPELPIEALTSRELEVLRLAAEGQTYEAIAARLVVSINTVRTHIKNIYGKLGVQSRTQAVTRARQLRLLE